MKTKTVFLFLLPVFIAIASCGFLDGESYSFIDPIEGTYIWTRTTGGFFGRTITPDSVDYTQKLKIRDDTAVLYRNDDPSRTFKIRYEKKEWTEEETWVFYPQEGEFKIAYFINDKAELQEGRLTLFPTCFDCYSIHFKKK